MTSRDVTPTGGTGRRTGRRPGKSTTREEILSAARAMFVDLGYERVTIRAIAATAGVDPALVLRYYGSKEQLFRQAVGWPFDPSEAIGMIVSGDRAGAGERLARFVVSAWDGENAKEFTALIRAADANDDAARILGAFLEHGIIGPVAAALGTDAAPVRAGLISAQFLGVFFARHILRSGPLARATSDELIEALAPQLQHLLAPES